MRELLMRKTLTPPFFITIFIVLLMVDATNALAEYSVSGSATYDFVPTQTDSVHGNAWLNYDGIVSRPIRRAVVQAVDSQLNVVAQTLTENNGHYTIEHLPDGLAVKVRVAAQSVASDFAPSPSDPSPCQGATWNIAVVDNTNSQAQWAILSQAFVQNRTLNLNLHAPLRYSQGHYQIRSAAPFALLDTVVTEMEMICATQASLVFPDFEVNWSPANTAVAGNEQEGHITTTRFRDLRTAPAGSFEGTPLKLYVLGHEDLDTDEFDSAIIAHEYAHYIQTVIYRSDTIGGNHRYGITLDPRLSFIEGLATAMSAITFNNPSIIDTSGPGQRSSYTINLDQQPQGNQRSIYDEQAVSHFIWKLFKQRAENLALSRSTENPFSRIHNILFEDLKNSPAFNTLHSFAAYYNHNYGPTDDNFAILWTEVLDQPYDSLCIGRCNGRNSIADPFDTNNDIGRRIGTGGASPRLYWVQSSSINTGGLLFNEPTMSADFWKLYEPLRRGRNQSQHNHTLVANSESRSSIGAYRWYRFTATGSQTTIAVANPVGATCQQDVLDMQVFQRGSLVAQDISEDGNTAGCPVVSFQTTIGETYVIVVHGFYSSVRSWTMVVGP